jgi:diguanylate cyclase (GGDEF)-like protein/PAS domain S-box-containing protein
MERRLEILLVEDNRADAELIVRELHRSGLNCSSRLVDSESDLRDALERAKPDAVLSDFTLPGFSGLDALKIVREKLRDTPFIFVSGTIGEERAFDAVKRGATDYVLKDNLPRLGPVVRRALQESGERFERRSAERSLRETGERLKSILGSLTDVVWSLSGDQQELLYFNAGLEATYGRAASEFKENPELLVECVHADDRERVEAHWKGLWEGRRFDLEYRILHPDGAERWLHHRSWPVWSSSGGILRVDAIIRDITEHRRYETRIEHLATHDPLTDLPNRNLLADRLRQIVARAGSNGSRFAVLFLDLDGFKSINDRYGHDSGDELLRAVAARLRTALRGGDIVGRLGGDEFVIVLGDAGTRPGVLALANRVLQEVFLLPFSVDSRKLNVQASVGVCIYPDDALTGEQLLRGADAAMYQAKKNGRDCVCLYTREMSGGAGEREDLVRALWTALKERQFELAYQPQFELASGRIYGVEAVLRWRHPEAGFISPARFLPLAREAGLLAPIEEWALKTACAEVRRWGHLALSLAVGLPANHAGHKKFFDMVEGVLTETGFDPHRLVIELTETLLPAPNEAVVNDLQQLKAIGVRISLNDFGTGHASLTHLKSLPIDTLKIDRSFIQSVGAGAGDASVAKGIIAMARALGMRTVAEGVETGAQLDFLIAQKCDAIQGRCICPALPADRLGLLFGPTAPLAVP